MTPFKVGDKVRWNGTGWDGHKDPTIYIVSEVGTASFKISDGAEVNNLEYGNKESSQFDLVEAAPVEPTVAELKQKLEEQEAAAEHDHDYLAELERKLNRAKELQKSAEDRVAGLIAERIVWETAAKLNSLKLAEALLEFSKRAQPGDRAEVTLTLTVPSKPKETFTSGCAGPSTSVSALLAADLPSELKPAPWCSPLNLCGPKCFPGGVRHCWCNCHDNVKTDPGQPL